MKRTDILKGRLKEIHSDAYFLILISIVLIVLFFIPTGYERAIPPDFSMVTGDVLEVENSDILQHGIVKSGYQTVEVKIAEGKFSGRVVTGVNQLTGKMEFDKTFIKGDRVLLSIKTDSGKIIDATVIDHSRTNIELFLLGAFIVFLIAFAGWTGIKAVVSFLFTGMIIWKVLIPGFLNGYDPVLLSLAVVAILTSAIIFLIGGITKKGFVAFGGAISGVLMTCILSIVFGYCFQIHGAVKQFSETILYSGFPYLDLTEIFLAGIFISSSGAVMDIAMDIAASQNELIRKRPDISRKEIIHSGFAVGKAVVGTMTTTLLLAYSGGFTALMMVFMAQGTPVINIFNLNYVAAEILHTLVGSFGLVTVAPFTAIIGGYVFSKHTKQ